MTNKRTSLEEMLSDIETGPESEPEISTLNIPPQTTTISGAGNPKSRKRTGIKHHTAYLPISVHLQLKKLGLDEDRKVHDYIMEGIDHVFADRGLPSIGELTLAEKIK